VGTISNFHVKDDGLKVTTVIYEDGIKRETKVYAIKGDKDYYVDTIGDFSNVKWEMTVRPTYRGEFLVPGTIRLKHDDGSLSGNDEYFIVDDDFQGTNTIVRENLESEDDITIMGDVSSTKPVPPVDNVKVSFNDVNERGAELKIVDGSETIKTITDYGDYDVPSKDNQTYDLHIELVDNTDSFKETPYYILDGIKTDFTMKNSAETNPVTLSFNGIDNEKIEIYGRVSSSGDNGGGDGGETSGFNHIYKVTKDDLNELSKERFEVVTADFSADLIDLGQNILNVMKIPFSVDDFLGGNNKIVLGNKTTKVTAPEITSDLLEVDLGSIKVTEKFGNLFDYMNTTTTIYLPYIEEMELDKSYVIGETIYIKYVIDLYSGDVTVNITNTKNEQVKSKTTTIGRQIPFIQEQEHTQMFSEYSGNTFFNGIYHAYIIVSRNEPVNIDNDMNPYISDYGQLKNFTSRIVVDNVDLKTNATLQEKQEIISILEEGLNIN